MPVGTGCEAGKGLHAGGDEGHGPGAALLWGSGCCGAAGGRCTVGPGLQGAPFGPGDASGQGRWGVRRWGCAARRCGKGSGEQRHGVLWGSGWVLWS